MSFLSSGLIYGFPKIKSFKSEGLSPKTTFSIVVPFRNEAENLSELLASFSKLNYPIHLFEFIFVNDDSSDNSEKIITKWRMENGLFHTTVLDNVRISNSPKKMLFRELFLLLKNEWIITTDADCVVNENWLLTLDNYIQKNDVSMIVGAVTYDYNRSFLHRFQQMDLMSLQGATIGSFGLNKGFMCNGANFAYRKPFFEELNGFKGNSNIASGDDVFLLQKAVSKFPEKVHYLKSDCRLSVLTKPTNNWKTLFYQRVRWASKTTSYENEYGEVLAMGVFFGNLSLIITLIFCRISSFTWHYLLILFLVKFLLDLCFIVANESFFE